MPRDKSLKNKIRFSRFKLANQSLFLPPIFKQTSFIVLIAFFFTVVLGGGGWGKYGARPMGIGGAFTALADDANAPYRNPASLAINPETNLVS